MTNINISLIFWNSIFPEPGAVYKALILREKYYTETARYFSIFRKPNS